MSSIVSKLGHSHPYVTALHARAVAVMTSQDAQRVCQAVAELKADQALASVQSFCSATLLDGENEMYSTLASMLPSKLDLVRRFTTQEWPVLSRQRQWLLGVGAKYALSLLERLALCDEQKLFCKGRQLVPRVPQAFVRGSLSYLHERDMTAHGSLLRLNRTWLDTIVHDGVTLLTAVSVRPKSFFGRLVALAVPGVKWQAQTLAIDLHSNKDERTVRILGMKMPWLRTLCVDIAWDWIIPYLHDKPSLERLAVWIMCHENRDTIKAWRSLGLRTLIDLQADIGDVQTATSDDRSLMTAFPTVHLHFVDDIEDVEQLATDLLNLEKAPDSRMTQLMATVQDTETPCLYLCKGNGYNVRVTSNEHAFPTVERSMFVRQC